MTEATLTRESDRAAVANLLRIGKIGFLNVVPMHWQLGIEPAFTGTPTQLNTALVQGDIDVACISSIEYARHAEELILLPSLCIAADGAVGSIYAISNCDLEEVEEWHCTSASATSVALLQSLCALRGSHPTFTTLDRSPQDVLQTQRRGVLLIGDEAMTARREGGLGDAVFTDLGERWHAETGLPMVYAVWAVRREVAEREPAAVAALDGFLVESVERFANEPGGVDHAAQQWNLEPHAVRAYFDRLCYGFGANERKGLIRFLRMSHENGLLDKVPSPEFVRVLNHPDPATGLWDSLSREQVHSLYAEAVGSSAAVKPRSEDLEAGEMALEMEETARSCDVDSILNKALNDERLTDVEAVALLQSKRLIDIGQVSHELRLRRTPDDVVTFVVDRNINYTNLCITDCGFCAFFRKPGDDMEGYLHSNKVILEKIRETIDLGGTAALLQGGHNPDLGIEYYVDLFTAVKKTYPSFHLHALSPPEIQHIARRSKMSVVDVLTTLRDAGLDSLPGGGGEILVDRVRRIIAPKKTKGSDWIGIMRDAQRLGMSTTASMMYGHAELLAERVLHMKMVRDLQDETGGFRAFISWTFQPGNTPLSQLIESGHVDFADKLPSTPTAFDYLLTQAVSRIYLDNVDNIQSSWVTQGMKVGQAALLYGANDMGSIMIEENVVSSAGTTYRATVEDFVHAISATGKRPVQRDTLYRTVKEHTL